MRLCITKCASADISVPRARLFMAEVKVSNRKMRKNIGHRGQKGVNHTPHPNVVRNILSSDSQSVMKPLDPDFIVSLTWGKGEINGPNMTGAWNALSSASTR